MLPLITLICPPRFQVYIKEIIPLLSLFSSISHFAWNSCGRVPEETKPENVLAVRAFGEAAPTLRYVTLCTLLFPTSRLPPEYSGSSNIHPLVLTYFCKFR